MGLRGIVERKHLTDERRGSPRLDLGESVGEEARAVSRLVLQIGDGCDGDLFSDDLGRRESGKRATRSAVRRKAASIPDQTEGRCSQVASDAVEDYRRSLSPGRFKDIVGPPRIAVVDGVDRTRFRYHVLL